MDKREKILKNIGSEEDRILAVKIIDYIDQVNANFDVRFTDFLDPAQVNKAVKIIEQYSGIGFIVTSGVPDCERNIIAVYPDYMEGDNIELPIEGLSISGKTKFESITHRDILGALMSLGIKREKIGDIILNNDMFYTVVYSDISYYISINLTKIKHTPVVVEHIDFSDIAAHEKKFKVINANVASLRLDAICSVGYGESRNSIVDEIKCGNVKVNWEEEKNTSYIINPNDVISIKGKGRIILDAVNGETKKGRINITIKKII